MGEAVQPVFKTHYTSLNQTPGDDYIRHRVCNLVPSLAATHPFLSHDNGVTGAYPSCSRVIEERTACDRASHVVLKQSSSLSAAGVAVELAGVNHAYRVCL